MMMPCLILIQSCKKKEACAESFKGDYLATIKLHYEQSGGWSVKGDTTYTETLTVTEEGSSKFKISISNFPDYWQCYFTKKNRSFELRQQNSGEKKKRKEKNCIGRGSNDSADGFLLVGNDSISYNFEKVGFGNNPLYAKYSIKAHKIK
jgi:hypothetical protein